MKTPALFFSILLVTLPLFGVASTDLWPKSHPDAPFARMKFFEKSCECPRGLNSTAYSGFCYNSTSQTLQEVPCENVPFWGVVFAWWIGAGLLMGAASTTGYNVFREFLVSISLYILKEKTEARPRDCQVAVEVEVKTDNKMFG